MKTAALALVCLLLSGCAFNVDVNGYRAKAPASQPAYCLVPNQSGGTFKLCKELKHELKA